MSETFKLTPEFAHMLATMSTSELLAYYGEEALFLARFVQGREKRELPPPTDEEFALVGRWLAQLIADQTLFSLTLKGMAYVDVTDDGELGWQVTGDGAAALGKE